MLLLCFTNMISKVQICMCICAYVCVSYGWFMAQHMTCFLVVMNLMLSSWKPGHFVPAIYLNGAIFREGFKFTIFSCTSQSAKIISGKNCNGQAYLLYVNASVFADRDKDQPFYRTPKFRIPAIIMINHRSIV